MAKEILLYTSMFSFSIEDFINSMEEAKSQDINIRFNSPGGDVFRGWGAITKIKEHKKAVNGIVDGFAASMAGVMLPYLDKVTAVNVAWVMIHAATDPSSEQDPQRAEMHKKVNEDLLKAFENKVDANKFREIAGVSLEDLFLNPVFAKKDVWLTAEQSKEIGLIDEVLDINAEEFTALEKNFAAINKNILFLNQQSQNDDGKKGKNKPEKTEKMTKSELKEKHPEVYNAIYNEGVIAGEKTGETKERDRVTAFANFYAVDPEGVSKSIKEGEDFNNAALSDLTQKAIKTGVTAAAEADSPGADDDDKGKDGKGTPSAADDSGKPGDDDGKGKDEKKVKIDNFLAEVDSNLGLKTSKN